MAKKTLLATNQQKFIALFNKEKSLTKRFYLTGGTALAEFYLRHRYSEDLDFFSEEEFILLPLRAFVKKVEKAMNAEKIDYENFLGLHTFLFRFSNERLKIDFNYYPFPRIEKGLRIENLMVDSIYDIAVNKVHTVSMQPRARDFIDIYFIIKEKRYSLHKLLVDAKAKFDWHIDPAQLGTQLMRAVDLKDYPRMIKKIDHQEWKDFFIAEAEKLKKDIFI